MTPAATVSGATPARTKNSTAGTPSRSRARARDTLLGLRPAGVRSGHRCDSWVAGGDGIGPGLIRGGRAGRCPRRPGSGRSGPAGRDRAGCAASSRRWRALGGRYSDSWWPSPQAAASPAEEPRSGRLPAADGPSADFTRTSGANAQSGVHRNPPLGRARNAARASGSGTPTAPAAGQRPPPRCGPGTAASPAPRCCSRSLTTRPRTERANSSPGGVPSATMTTPPLRSDVARAASARPAARQPGPGPAARGCRCGLPVISWWATRYRSSASRPVPLSGAFTGSRPDGEIWLSGQ